jgi:hypothetical protein
LASSLVLREVNLPHDWWKVGDGHSRWARFKKIEMRVVKEEGVVGLEWAERLPRSRRSAP